MEYKFGYRNTKEEDYEVLKGWWKSNRFAVPPRLMLPDNFSDGIMVSYEGRDIFAGFIYGTTASQLFHIEYIVSDFDFKDREVRKQAKMFLLKGLIYMAKQRNGRVIFSSVVNPNLIKDYLEVGFVEGSKNATELVCII